MPTEQEIKLWDMNFDGVLDGTDVKYAEQVHSKTIADMVRKIVEGSDTTSVMGTTDLATMAEGIGQGPT